MSPAEFVEKHPITQELLHLGVTKDQLDSIRFRSNNQGFAFEFWSVRVSPNTPMIALPLFKPYCTLKWLLIENPPDSRDKQDAWRYLNDLRVAADVQLGQKHRAEQAMRAQNSRVKVGDQGETIREVIKALALHPEHREKSVPQLWPIFFAKLEDLARAPKELVGVKAYTYEGSGKKRRRMTFSWFRKIVYSCRKDKGI